MSREIGRRPLNRCFSNRHAARNRLPHRFVDLDQDDAAEVLLRQLGVGGRTPQSS